MSAYLGSFLCFIGLHKWGEYQSRTMRKTQTVIMARECQRHDCGKVR